MKNKRLIICIIITCITVILVIFVISINFSMIGKLNISKALRENTITLADIRGKYVYTKTYINESGEKLNLNIKITLDMDNTATYEASDGYNFEKTKGTYVIIENKIVYIRKYYNDGGVSGQDSIYKDEDFNTETFIVLNKNNLKKKLNFHDQEVILQRQQ